MTEDKHNIYASVLQDGSVWLRLGVDYSHSNDWSTVQNKRIKFQTRLLKDSDIALLQSLPFFNYCVLTDLNFELTIFSGWNPSFITYFDPSIKESRIVSLKLNKDCQKMVNVSMNLSSEGQELKCQGKLSQPCYFKKPPSETDVNLKTQQNQNNFFSNTNFSQISTIQNHIKKNPTFFLRYIYFDLYGGALKPCGFPNPLNSYSFNGSYYHIYVKVDQCTPQNDSRGLGKEVKLRRERDFIQNTIILPDPSQIIKQKSKIRTWQFFAKIVSVEHWVYLQIWRPTNKTKKLYMIWENSLSNQNISVHHPFLSYKLVEQKLVRPNDLRVHEVIIDPPMLVEKGDVIGLYFPKFNPIGWSSVPCSNNPFQPYRFFSFSQNTTQDKTKFSSDFFSSHSSQSMFSDLNFKNKDFNFFKKNIEVNFKTSFSPFSKGACRSYSLIIYFANKSHLKMLEDWKCPQINSNKGFSTNIFSSSSSSPPPKFFKPLPLPPLLWLYTSPYSNNKINFSFKNKNTNISNLGSFLQSPWLPEAVGVLVFTSLSLFQLILAFLSYKLSLYHSER